MPKIFGAFLGGVLTKAPVDVGSNTGIQTAIAAENHVNRPVHIQPYEASFDLFSRKLSRTADAAPTKI